MFSNSSLGRLFAPTAWRAVASLIKVPLANAPAAKARCLIISSRLVILSSGTETHGIPNSKSPSGPPETLNKPKLNKATSIVGEEAASRSFSCRCLDNTEGYA
jgi:hypothetical protein